MKGFFLIFGFAVLLGFLAKGLWLNPQEIPSALINQPAPDFHLKTLDEKTVISPTEYRGKVWLLNYWASWCESCRDEQPTLVQEAPAWGVPFVGIDYKDDKASGQAWLKTWGNPYLTAIQDIDGSVGIDYGVSGVPETFVIDKKGIIRYKFIGPMSPKAIAQQLLPLLAKLKTE